ncbi:MAG: triose-phosphate isomerase [Tenericutes bacterium GWC2_39_45]|nr:MAG: triose-phosphate isomerase [Tenericutes bacterium GWA2_38_26]OHE31169.1 MAG: triose-phosphate isomerase [Tenericutes bacterium GWC2_39_45]OHE31699.1 MAG: triose-phosphate isomerase [Tenericutes bacterium GWD2_38_27]OHE37524.1 MAG: triose-phosphate isomerase [Tenericutes bacterium GWE2_38_8]OHE41794.1 MAG: triose-phosphate isomerase [Tenericutes bacterium GWF2_38_8]HBG32696.1 triose-phosphate isomerase [Acholeplasmataceae bacterium]
MRKPIIAGNWKMYKTKDDALAFIYAVNLAVPSKDLVESVICAPSIFLRDLVKREGENIKIGAQNMHYANEGAYTGETSAAMLKSYGVDYVVIGHSERRAYFNETDETVNLKVIQAINNDITPILCVGESLEIREAGTTDQVVKKQIEKAYLNVDAEEALKTVIAYEPIWAIGTGRTATPDQANDTIKAIRNVLQNLYGKEVAEAVRILYGGSVNTKNIESLLSMSDIDGALVGGASLDPNSFLTLVKAAAHK